MTSFEQFKEIITLCKNNKIKYWVFGGYALEGIRGKVTRKHGDVDVYIHTQDVQRFLGLFNSQYKIFQKEGPSGM